MTIQNMQNKDLELSNNLKIGDVELKSRVTLAPMAGITDMILRQMIREFSPECLLVSEMVSSEALNNNAKTSIIECDEKEHPLSFQISGHKPHIMAKAAMILEDKCSIIDINMGCPVPKIVRNGDGSALMQDLKLSSAIISEVKNAVKIPVTAKFRLGWDCESINAVEFAKMAQDSGADAICVHGRTRTQMYSGEADWEKIAEVKQAVSIPVIGNGDITSVEKAIECLELSKCDGIAIGRGVMGDPELISRLEHYFVTGEILQEPTIQRRLELALEHTKREMDFRSELFAIKFMRKFFAWYIRGIRGASQYRARLVKVETLEDIESIFDEIRENV